MILIFEHFPKVANRSVSFLIISSSVMIKAYGLICGGKFTEALIERRDPANLFTNSNFS